MRFLLPVGGIVDHRFGILTAPNHKGVPAGIAAGMDWGADVGCLDGPAFVKRANLPGVYRWLRETMSPYWSRCLFVAGWDVVVDAQKTIDAFQDFGFMLSDWPLAFCAQDGQECLEFPPHAWWDVLFVGGSTFWKCSDGAVTCIKRAQALGKRIHIGRVNWPKRYRFFRQLEGSDDFTCDGTRTRFNGTAQTVEAWAELMAESQSDFEVWPCRLPGF